MIKDLYGRVMPSSKKQLNVKAEDIKKKLTRIEEATKRNNEEEKVRYQNLEKNMSIIRTDVESQIKDIKQQCEKDFSHYEAEITEKFKIVMDRLDSLQKQTLGEMKKQLHLMDLQEKKILRASNEAVWAEIFHDAICESEWLKNKTFYPGRWAAGYPYLYALYRCLNELRPKNILEMGLGQTTRLIGQYAAYEKDCYHIVTEHDENWITFFQKDFSLSDNTEIVKLNIKKELYHGTDQVTVYDHFEEELAGRKFDLISIDAPFGGDTLNYSRIDILKILPQCLNDSFVILLDDYNRKGEKNMIEELKHILEENKIEYTTGLYWGNKDTFMITSANLSFLCTM